jgi:uncharacterized protein (TIGR04255 family)
MLHFKKSKGSKKDPVVPTKLKHDTILETVAEIWFSSSEPSAGDLLPGLMFHSLRSEFPTLQKFPTADIPKQFRDGNPAFLRQPLQSLNGKNKRVYIGDRSIGVSHNLPYPGWSSVKQTIVNVVDALKKSELITNVERVSLKYSNILEMDNDKDQLMLIDIDLKLGGYDLRMPGRFIRGEFDIDDFIAIVDVKTGAVAIVGEIQKQGLSVDVDVIFSPTINYSIGELADTIEKLHNTEKKVYFGLLTESTIEQLGPVWNES